MTCLSLTVYLAVALATVLLINIEPSTGFAHLRRMKRSLNADEAQIIDMLFDDYMSINRKTRAMRRRPGYVSKTWSSDPVVAGYLQTHVKQMADLVAEGRQVRMWDPAIKQYFNNIDDIRTRTVNLTNGVKSRVRGTNDMAMAIACNHANGISLFVQNGPDERPVKHDAVPEADEYECEIDIRRVINEDEDSEEEEEDNDEEVINED